jgi:hypothetical protein
MDLLTGAATAAQLGSNSVDARNIGLLELVVLDLLVRKASRALPLVALTTLEPL